MNESNQWLLWTLPVFFGVLWCAIFFVIARWGGWTSLAVAYPSRGIPAGESFRMRSASLRAGCNYNNCITYVSGPIGLYMSLPFVFSFQHDPVFIPWSELQVDVDRLWFGTVVVLTPARCPTIAIKLRSGLANQLLAAAGRSVESR